MLAGCGGVPEHATCVVLQYNCARQFSMKHTLTQAAVVITDILHAW